MDGTPPQIVPWQRRLTGRRAATDSGSELEVLVQRLARLVLNSYALAGRLADLPERDSAVQAERQRRLWATVDRGRWAIIAAATMPSAP